MRKKWIWIALPLALAALLLFVADSRPKSEIEGELRIARVEVDEIQFEWFPEGRDGSKNSRILIIQRGADALKTIHSLHPDMSCEGISICYAEPPEKLVLRCYSRRRQVATVNFVENHISYHVVGRENIGKLPTKPETKTYINDLIRPFGHQL